MSKLSEMAKIWPECDYCGLENPNGDLLCLCHSNELRHGRGAWFKSKDLFGAFGCQRCHDLVDGRQGSLTKEQKREMHRKANAKMLERLILNDALEVKGGNL